MTDPSLFAQLGVSPRLAEKITALGFSHPTPVQTLAIPPLLAHHSACLASCTGSGKTLAFLLPVIDSLSFTENSLQAIIVVPTTELAVQLGLVFASLVPDSLGRHQLLVGSGALQRQIDGLRLKPHLVIGTPGRLCALVAQKKLSLGTIQSIVIDEADETLALEEGSALLHLLKKTPRSTAIIFSSATISPSTLATLQTMRPQALYLDPMPLTKDTTSSIPTETIPTTLASALPPTIEHTYVLVEPRDRIELVRKLWTAVRPTGVLLFVQKTEHIATILAKLRHLGIVAEAVYGEQPKLARTQAMARFRSQKATILITTDLLARGIDASHVSHIFHYDAPYSGEQYVHRAGRTGRIGRRGTSVLFIDPRQLFVVDKLAKQTAVAFEAREVRFGEFVRVTSSSTNKKKTASSPALAIRSEKKRHHQQKNKGAPRWLKEKDSLSPHILHKSPENPTDDPKP